MLKNQLIYIFIIIVSVSTAFAKSNLKQNETITSPDTTISKDTLQQVLRFIKKQEEQANGLFHFGISIGSRLITDIKNNKDVSISPIDTSLHFDKRDNFQLIISGVMLLRPFSHSQCLNWLGFIVNINLIDFSDKNISTVHNKNFEGGVGLSFLNFDDFNLGITYEYIFNRRLRDNIERLEKKHIIEDGKLIRELDESNNNYFIDDHLNAISLNLVFCFK